MGRSEILRRWRHYVTVAGALATASLTLTSTALGQPARVGATFYPKPVDGTTRRFSAVAYDAANDVYVVAWGLGSVGVRYVSASGVPIGVPSNVNLTTSGPPGIACAADQNMCLVVWIQEPASIIGRLIRYNAGSVQALTSTFVINSNGKSKLTDSAPDVAYSPVANEFLVAWAEYNTGGPDIHGQRISPNAAKAGAEMIISSSSYWEGRTSLAYNSAQDEYLVGYYCEAPSGADSLCAQRVKPGTGALIGARKLVYTSTVDIYPEIAYNSTTNQYLVIAWGATGPWMLHGWLADSNLTPIGGTKALATQGGGDGVGLAYNPSSNTYLAVYQSQKNAEVWGVEVSAAGAPGPQAQLTSSGTTLSTQPAVAAGATAKFVAAASNNFTKVMAQYVAHGSMVSAGTTGTGGTGGTGGSTGGCTTVQPGANWICVNGGWIPSTTTSTSSCTTVSPGTGWTCVNGSWLPPTTGTGSTGSTCKTVKPGTGWTCVNGSWMPPGSTTTTTSSCKTVSPGTGWTCVNGSWLPPTTGGTTGSTCKTVKPGTGWTCVNGGWLPPGSTTTTSSCTTVRPGTGWTCVNGSWLPPTTTTSSCTTVKPGTGWTCVSGNWLPPQ